MLSQFKKCVSLVAVALCAFFNCSASAETKWISRLNLRGLSRTGVRCWPQSQSDACLSTISLNTPAPGRPQNTRSGVSAVMTRKPLHQRIFHHGKLMLALVTLCCFRVLTHRRPIDKDAVQQEWIRFCRQINDVFLTEITTRRQKRQPIDSLHLISHYQTRFDGFAP